MAAKGEDDDSWLYGREIKVEGHVDAVDQELVTVEDTPNTVEELIQVKQEPLDDSFMYVPPEAEAQDPLAAVKEEEASHEPMDAQPSTSEALEETTDGLTAEETGQDEGPIVGETGPEEIEAAGEESQADSEEDDDDVQVTIGEVKAGVPAYETPKFKGSYQRPAVTPQTAKAPVKGVDVDAIGVINDTSIYEFDLDSLNMEDRPWRKPGADITDYFNYGFNEDTWRQYCEKQRRLRIDNQSGVKVFMPNVNRPMPRNNTTDYIMQRLEPYRPPNVQKIASLTSATPTSINVIGSSNWDTRRPSDQGFNYQDEGQAFMNSGGSTPPPPGVHSSSEPIPIAAHSAMPGHSPVSRAPPQVSLMIPMTSMPPPIVSIPQGVAPPNLAMPPPGMNMPPPGMGMPPIGMGGPHHGLMGVTGMQGGPRPMVVASQVFGGPPPNMQRPPPMMQNFQYGPPPMHQHHGPPMRFGGDRPPNFGFARNPAGPEVDRFPGPPPGWQGGAAPRNDWMSLPLSDDDLSGSDEDERRMRREKEREASREQMMMKEREAHEANRSRRERSRSRDRRPTERRSRSKSRERRRKEESRHRSSRRDDRERSKRRDSPSRRRSKRDSASPTPSKVTNMTEVPAS